MESVCLLFPKYLQILEISNASRTNILVNLLAEIIAYSHLQQIVIEI